MTDIDLEYTATPEKQGDAEKARVTIALLKSVMAGRKLLTNDDLALCLDLLERYAPGGGRA